MQTPKTAMAPPEPSAQGISAGLTFLLAAACGLVAANIYYAQPLIGPISAALGLSPQAAGLIVTLTQIGYGLGLLLVVPLADLLENRRLVLALISLAVLGLLGAGLVGQALPFLICSLLIGLGSVAVQVLVPYAAHMASDATRGQVVGNVMSGLMLGIMLARPVASLVTRISAWPVVFLLSAAVMVALMLVLGRRLPQRRPQAGLSYGALMASMAGLLRTMPVLRQRALYQACLFGAFSLFWTATPLLLASPTFGLTQGGIALFGLAGVAGAIASPIAGRIADRGIIRPASAAAMGLVALSFPITHLAAPGSGLALALLVAAAILLDFGVTANLVLGQRAIFALGAHLRGRLNGLYMAIFFVGGALGSAIGGWSFAHGGWMLTSWIGAALPLLALLALAFEPR